MLYQLAYHGTFLYLSWMFPLYTTDTPPYLRDTHIFSAPTPSAHRPRHVMTHVAAGRAGGSDADEAELTGKMPDTARKGIRRCVVRESEGHLLVGQV